MRRFKEKPKGTEAPKVRYAVVGAGWISQTAVLPAFEHAQSNSEIVALVSGDETKRTTLGMRYGLKTYSYEQYDECLSSKEIDAVYIAVPNSLHYDFAMRAAEKGVHVLCEKPFAANSEQCRDIIQSCRVNGVKLMVAYRLHFDEAHLEVISLLKSGKLGHPRFISSAFSMPVADGNIRLQSKLAGGPLMDLGIYCINASCYFFGETPQEAIALAGRSQDKRFDEVDETVSASLRFSEGKTSAFTCSFGGGDVSFCEIVGTKGSLRLEPAFDFTTALSYSVTVEGKTRRKKFKRTDQFAPELDHFSRAIQEGKDPAPSGTEGLNDVLIIEAIQASIEQGNRIKLKGLGKEVQPAFDQREAVPPSKVLPLVNAQNPEAA